MSKTKDEIRKGQFYTPQYLAKYANEEIEKHFGTDWRNKYVVWDCACGEKALTKDYYFNELYSSTIDESELNNSAEYNKEGTSFIFDFLNDEIDKLPEGLRNVFEQNKPIIIFINPPYAAGSTFTHTKEEIKKGVTKSNVQNEMDAEGLKLASRDLYVQFMYRLTKIQQHFNLTNFNICQYTPSTYLCGTTTKKFRDYLFDKFKYIDGTITSAAHFNCKGKWCVLWSMWSIGKTENKNEFKVKLVDYIDNEVKVIGTKLLYNLDNGYKASDWVREEIKGKKTYKYPNLSSALKIKEGGRGRMVGEPVGVSTLYNIANNIEHNSRGDSIVNGCTHKNGISITAPTETVGSMNNGGNNVEKNTSQISLHTSRFSSKGCLTMTAPTETIGNMYGVGRNSMDKNSSFISLYSSNTYDADSCTLTAPNDDIGYYLNNSNNVEKNNSGVSLYTSSFSGEDGLTMTAPNETVGYMNSNCNNVDKNKSEVGLYTTSYTDEHGISMTAPNPTKSISMVGYNALKCTALFAARALINCEWYNCKDEYMKPNTEHPKYKEYENDSIIISLFHFKSQQSSLRQIKYDNKIWDIRNEFFWLSKHQMMELAKEYNYEELYNDALVSNERFIYKYLNTITLSKEAQAVLDKATELLIKGFKYRQQENDEHREYHLNTFDASFYQNKIIWKKYLPNEYNEFQKLFKILCNKVRPMVYELGFLKDS